MRVCLTLHLVQGNLLVWQVCKPFWKPMRMAQCLLHCCRLVSKFRRWLESDGGGGPMAGAPLPPMEKRKEVLLERWHSHTMQCKSCQKVRPLELPEAQIFVPSFPLLLWAGC